MKKYHLFSFTEYYPGGGLNDYVGSYNTLEEAKNEAKREEKAGIEYDFKNEDGIITHVDKTYMRPVHDITQIIVVDENGNLVECSE